MLFHEMGSGARKVLPDPDIGLRDAADFILNSALGRKALACSDDPHLPIFLRDVITAIHRLVLSCHMPEFTDHGLPHLCSLVDRISSWSCAPRSGNCETLVKRLFDSREAAVLLMAALFHDIGMLSQKSEDLDAMHPLRQAKGQMGISEWVRVTHVPRIRGLVRRLFGEWPEYRDLLSSSLIESAFRVAEAHSAWPWQPKFQELRGREAGLAAVVAVSDLLDEDSNRCDVRTLIEHREGTMLNKSHWIRHSLSANRVLVSGGEILVRLVRPSGTDASLSPVFCALRNHYRLVLLYTEPLGLLGAGMLNVHFSPEVGCPSEEAPELDKWTSIPGLCTQRTLLYHLFTTFFGEALLDERRLKEPDLRRLRALGLEPIDLDFYYQIRGRSEIRSTYEQQFLALAED